MHSSMGNRAAGFERHARTVTALTLVSRITGFARDALLTRVFGAGPLMDAFNFGFQVPNLFRRLFGEGALSASFLPVYARLEAESPEKARRLAGVTLAWLAILLAAMTAVGEAALVFLPATGADGGIGVRLLMLMLPYMPFVCLTALLGAILQVHHRFGPTAASPIILNLMVAGTAFWGSGYAASLGLGSRMEGRAHVQLVALSVLGAGVLQLLWSAAALRRSVGAEARPDLGAWRRPGEVAAPLREVVAKALPMLVGLGVFQLNTAMDSLVASWRTIVGPTILGVEWPLPEGSMTFLSCAQRLYEFPLGVFGVAIATAIFPALARLRSDAEGFGAVLRRGLRLTVFIGLPASAGLIVVRTPLSAALFQGGRFSAEDSIETGRVLLGYAPAIWAYSMQQVVTRAFYALGDSATPTRVAVGMVGLNFVLNMTLIWTPLGVAGLAWSTAIAALVQVVIVLRILARRRGPLVDATVWRSWRRSLLATLICAAGAWGAIRGVDMVAPWAQGSWALAVAELAAAAAVGVAAYAGAARALRMPELSWALARGHRGSPEADDAAAGGI